MTASAPAGSAGEPKSPRGAPEGLLLNGGLADEVPPEVEPGERVLSFLSAGSSFDARLAPSPVEWDGPRGGDAVLSAAIELLQTSEWLQQCMRRSDGKARMWELVATHLPGRTPGECRERWRSLSHRRHAEEQAARARDSERAEGGGRSAD